MGGYMARRDGLSFDEAEDNAAVCWPDKEA